MDIQTLSYNLPVPLTDPPPTSARTAHVSRVKAALLRSAQNTLDSEGFTQVLAPSLTTLSGACGDPGTLIPVQRDGGNKTYLRQTSQLYLEPLMRELGKVYSVSRSFRSERRMDDRHLSEFTLIEAEASDWPLSRTMLLMEQMVMKMLRDAEAFAGESLATLGASGKSHELTAPFSHIAYDDAIIALQKQGSFIEWGEDLSNAHELALTEMHGPLFVTHYPVETRFFTMKVNRDDPRVVECCDLLLPEVGEVMGASETETDVALLEQRLVSSRGVKQMLDLGGTAEEYSWYIAMHKRHSAQQSGFGMGFERVARYACGLRSIREVIS